MSALVKGDSLVVLPNHEEFAVAKNGSSWTIEPAFHAIH